MNQSPEMTQHPPVMRPNLYLVGFMGTGKSVIGQKVARELEMDFIDSDQYIENKEAMKISEMFDRFGEPHFRKLESLFIHEWQPRQNAVIACGGGLITNDELLQIILSQGIAITLWASLDTLVNRLSGDKNRPLLATEDPRRRIQKLMEDRTEIYQKVGLGVNTDNRSISDIANHVKRIYLEKITALPQT